MEDRNAELGSEHPEDGLFSAAAKPPTGYRSCMSMPSTRRVLIKNVRLERDPSMPSRWLMEPLPQDVSQPEWTHVDLAPGGKPSDIYYRGRIDFICNPNAASEMRWDVRIARGEPEAAGLARKLESDLRPPIIVGRNRFRWLADGTSIQEAGLS